MHHQVRFAQHLFNLVDSTIANRDFVLMHWRTWSETGCHKIFWGDGPRPLMTDVWLNP